MPADLSNLQPVFNRVLPQVSEDVEAAVGLRDGGGEIEEPLLRRNWALALGQGDVTARWEFGALVARVLCEGQDGSHVR